jgi:hypothetical protein
MMILTYGSALLSLGYGFQIFEARQYQPPALLDQGRPENDFFSDFIRPIPPGWDWIKDFCTAGADTFSAGKSPAEK